MIRFTMKRKLVIFKVTSLKSFLIMAFDLTGKMVAKFDTIQRSATFKTREFVVETNEDINGRTITNFVKFQTVQDRTGILDRFNIGDTIKVHFNIKGSRWEKNGQTNYITNLDAWRIEQVSAGAGGPIETPPAFTPDPESPQGAADDLPF
jgi:hypothetical protein